MLNFEKELGSWKLGVWMIRCPSGGMWNTLKQSMSVPPVVVDGGITG